MSTEEERLAKKEAEIAKLKAKSERLQEQIECTLAIRVKTDQQKALFKKYRDLVKQIERLDQKYQEKSETLYNEREKFFDELNDSFE